MQKFLEELEKAKENLYNDSPEKTDAVRICKGMRSKFRALEGKRALLVSKVNKTSRVVTIEEAHERYVRVSYKYFGRDYAGKLNTCVNYLSLYCGDDRLDVE
jgi:hypothetical protein